MRCLAIALFCTFVAAETARPQQASPAQPEQQGSFLLAGMRHNRELLRKGVFHARGRKIDQSPQSGKLEGEVHIFSAFDYENDLLRFDRVEPVKAVDESPKGADGKGSPQPWRPFKTGGKYARTPKKTEIWLLNDDVSTTYPPGRPVPPQIKPFDVRSLGMSYWIELQRGISFPHAMEVYTKSAPESVAREKNGLYTLSWKKNIAGIEVLSVLWVDEKSGFSPVRLESRLRPPEGPKGKFTDVKMVSETSWELINGAWVPKTFRIEERYSFPRIQSYELTFDWVSVNQDVPEKLFSVKGFDLPKGTHLIDEQLGKPVIKEVVGGGPVTMRLPEQKQEKPPPRLRWPVIILPIGGGALFLVTGLLWHRWGQRPKPGG